MKMRIIIIFFALILLTFGFLSFLSMSQSMDNAHISCPFALATGVKCYQDGTLALLIHHISELHSYANIITASELLILIFSLTSFIVVLAFAIISPLLKLFWYARDYAIERIIFLGSRKKIHWISLHANQDPYDFYWAHRSFYLA